MLSMHLARRLRDAGLEWHPRLFDFFHIPDRDIERVFVIADLSVDVQSLADGIAAITFNGAVEWSLDYILQQDVVWVPTESQLRDALGDDLSALSREGDDWVCELSDGSRTHGPTAAEAYGSAVLRTLERKRG